MTFQKLLFAENNDFMVDAGNISDTLSNLTYLMELYADSPDLVRQYARQANHLLRAMENLLQSANSEIPATLVH
jgi:hypothetical protein